MAYSQPNDVRKVLAPGVWPPPEGQAAPVTHTAADLDDDQLTAEIAQADQLIDTYIGRYYTTPIDPVVGPLPTWSTNIAAYLATLTFRRGKDLQPTSPVVLRYAMTMQQLTAVQTGKSSIPGVSTNTGASGGGDAGAPFNPYTGNLFDSSEFNLRPDFNGPDPGIMYPGGLWPGRDIV